ncbi:MAG: GntR family transcriptional regulator [Christensenellales bacterium]
MEILISNASGLPIYEQITTQIKQKILSGELAAGEALPSIRALAKDLRISVITTKRAYDELEREGWCARWRVGCFVAAQPGMDSEELLRRQIETHLEKVAELAAQADVSGEELCEMLRALREEKEP